MYKFIYIYIFILHNPKVIISLSVDLKCKMYENVLLINWGLVHIPLNSKVPSHGPCVVWENIRIT